MQFGDEPESSNFRDDTGRSFGGFGGGGNMLGCLLPLIASRFGIGGLVILVVGYFLLNSLGGLGGGVQQPVSQQGAPAAQSRLDPNTKHFTLQVLKSTEDVWTKLLAQRGIRYTPTDLVFYNEEDNSGCGAAQSAMGPFYCPTDTDIYLDTEFFSELANKFQAPGDFAEAYVIAHEVGHHVQDLMGTLDQAHSAQARASSTEGNHIQVGIELQADCYAGVWAANARNPEGQPVMQPGDFEEGMRAAQAIGDDTLQRETQGTVVPDSFTHGTSAQRMNALRTGFQSGDPAACDIQKLESPAAG
jgi:predicted metalloprotease